MKWITENIQVILAVAGAIAFWLNSRREAAEKAAQENEAALRRASQPAALAETDVAADDELRNEQVRDKVRRMIAERRGEAVPPEWSAPPAMPEPEEERSFRSPPIEEPPELALPPPLSPPVWSQKAEAADSLAKETLEASLVRQEQLAVELQSLNEQRVLAARRAAVVAEGEAVVARRDLVSNELRHDLRDPRSLRRAMVLREVLGPPVALR
jgi:flagellar basal body-associated protein FliL